MVVLNLAVALENQQVVDDMIHEGTVVTDDNQASFISLQELLIVLARHIDVDIIVPRNIALMTNSSDECTTRQKVTQSACLAKMMDLVENAHLNLSQFVNVLYLSHSLLGAPEQPLLEERTDAEDV